MICEDGRECCRKTEKIRIDGSWGNPKNYASKHTYQQPRFLVVIVVFKKEELYMKPRECYYYGLKQLYPNQMENVETIFPWE